MLHDRKFKLYIWLNAAFLTFLIMAELMGSKLFTFLGFTLTMGVVPFPVTFLITDTLNEFYGKAAVKRTTLVGMVMILLVYLLILIGLQIPASPGSPVDDASFERVFASSGLVIIGSIIAYLIGQFIDIHVFHYLRIKTQGKKVWLRATGSTVISQLIDSFVVVFIAFGAYKGFKELLSIGFNNFVYKMLIAVALTPVIYLSHSMMEKYLGEDAIHMKDSAMKE
jgi:uncharacterized integral membrane protein (TIGR00697 family)